MIPSSSHVPFFVATWVMDMGHACRSLPKSSHLQLGLPKFAVCFPKFMVWFCAAFAIRNWAHHLGVPVIASAALVEFCVLCHRLTARAVVVPTACSSARVFGVWSDGVTIHVHVAKQGSRWCAITLLSQPVCSFPITIIIVIQIA